MSDIIDSDHNLMGKIIEVDESKFRYKRKYKRVVMCVSIHG